MKKGIVYHSVDQFSADWQKLVAEKITASIAGACLGVSPYLSPQKACRMAWGDEPHVSEYYLTRGRENEDVAADCYEAATGKILRKCGAYQNEESPWLVGCPDRTIVGGGIVQLHCSSKVWEFVPLHWIAEAYALMWCTGESFCDVAHWQDGCISCCHVQSLGIVSIIRTLEQFYNEYIREGIAPRKGSVEKCSDLLTLSPLSFVRYAC